jgi:hypothetical protein
LLASLADFAQSLDTNLLLYYPFNGTMADESGNGHTAQPFGPTFASDLLGNENSALYFDGDDDYLNFPNADELKVPLPVSFSFWIKYDGTNYQDHVVFNTSMEENHATSVVFNAQADTNRYVINYADGQYFYGPESRRSYVSNSTIDTEDWHHIAIVVNGPTDMKIYVDCTETGGTYSGVGGALAYSMQPGCIGRHDRSLDQPLDYFKGYIDEFRYWSRALNEDDIVKLCDVALGTVEVSAASPFTVYPNPVEDKLFIASGTDVLKAISIFDLSGKKVYSGSETGVDTSGFAPGVYVVKIEGMVMTDVKKVVIK